MTPKRSRFLADGALGLRGAPRLPDPTRDCAPLSFLDMHGTPVAPVISRRMGPGECEGLSGPASKHLWSLGRSSSDLTCLTSRRYLYTFEVTKQARLINGTGDQ